MRPKLLNAAAIMEAFPGAAGHKPRNCLAFAASPIFANMRELEQTTTQKLYSKGISGLGQFGILLGMTGAGLVFGSIIGAMLLAIMLPGKLADLETSMMKPENINALLTMQGITTFFVFFIPPVVFAIICYRNALTFLGFKAKVSFKQIIIVILIVAACLPIVSSLGELNKMIPLPANWRKSFDAAEAEYMKQVAAMAQVKTWPQYFTSVFIIALLPAIFEETFFRGGMQHLLYRRTHNLWLSLIVTSIIFSLIHLSWYGFFARMALGIMLGLIFHYTGSIWLNILAHFLNNALVVTALFYDARHGKPVNLSPEEDLPVWLGAIGLALVIPLFMWLLKTWPQTRYIEVNTRNNNPFLEDVA